MPGHGISFMGGIKVSTCIVFAVLAAADQDGMAATTADIPDKEVEWRLWTFGLMISCVGAALIVAALAAVRRKQNQRKAGISKDEETGISLLLPPNDERTVEEIEELIDEQQRLAQAHSAWHCSRRILLLIVFLVYVGLSIGLPLMKAGTASCTNGFFWEDHLVFVLYFFATKALELALYSCDPTITGNLGYITFFMKFIPSFFGYADGYTDSTSMVIAASCASAFAQQLATWMMWTYWIGVVFVQWIVIAVFAQLDPSQACLMKLLHMDVLAASVSVPKKMQRIWILVNIARTFGEDIPQAITQTLFLIYVKHNYIMIVSVAFSVLSSLKALWDAAHFVGAAIGARHDEDDDNVRDTNADNSGEIPPESMDEHGDDVQVRARQFQVDLPLAEDGIGGDEPEAIRS